MDKHVARFFIVKSKRRVLKNHQGPTTSPTVVATHGFPPDDVWVDNRNLLMHLL